MKTMFDCYINDPDTFIFNGHIFRLNSGKSVIPDSIKVKGDFILSNHIKFSRSTNLVYVNDSPKYLKDNSVLLSGECPYKPRPVGALPNTLPHNLERSNSQRKASTGHRSGLPVPLIQPATRPAGNETEILNMIAIFLKTN